MTKRSLILISLAALIAGCSSEAETAAAPSQPTALVMNVSGAGAPGVVAVGTVRSANRHDIALEHGGRVTAFSADVGDRVRRGQILAHIDPGAFQAGADQARAALGQAQANLEEAQRNAKRVNGLADAGAASESDREATQAAANRAAQQMRAANAQAQLANRDLNRSTVISPTDGVIAARSASLSSLVTPGGVLFSIDGDGEREIEARVPGAVASQLSIDQEVAFRYGAETGRARLDGVSERGAGIDIRTARFTVIAGQPTPGVAAELLFSAGNTSEPTFNVPMTAVLAGRNGADRSVLAVTPQGRLEAVSVEIVQVTSLGAAVRGALAGRTIVAAGGENLSPNQIVHPVPYTF